MFPLSKTFYSSGNLYVYVFDSSVHKILPTFISFFVSRNDLNHYESAIERYSQKKKEKKVIQETLVQLIAKANSNFDYLYAFL